jgi:formylglycine-generating enzyme required for sulfatase activity
MQELKGHLIPLERAGMIDAWCDQEIAPGVEWENEILTNLAKSDIILPLVSSSYFESSFIHEKEMKIALQRHVEKKSVLLPIILRPCKFNVDPVIGKIQVLPANAKPVTSEATKVGRETIWLKIVAEIENIVKKFRSDDNKLFDYELIPVDGGNFSMGNDNSTSSSATDECPHNVNVSSFYIGKFTVTQYQWESVMGNNPSFFKHSPMCPVENVSWFEVHEFIETVNQKTGLSYRLPFESEWEYAAKGGKFHQKSIYAGGDNLDEVGWYDSNSKNQTQPVGQKIPNKLGIHDMSGNVWEWCTDWFKPYPECTGVDYTGRRKIGRGGSWQNKPINCRVTDRGGIGPATKGNFLGFRLVLEH